MNRRSLLGNVTIAFLAQGIAMISSIIASLVAPKVLSLESFGYWQLFLLYCAYSGLFHFGLNDGVYLLNGGKTLESLNSKSIYSQLRIAVIFQITVFLVITLVSLLLVDDINRLLIVFSFAVYTAIYNLASFVGYFLQAINLVRIYSFSVMLSKITFLVLIVTPFVLRISSYLPLVFAFTLGQIFALVYLTSKLQKIIPREPVSLRVGFRDGRMSILVGSSLMIANLANILIIGICRFVIDARWDIEEFGKLSLVFSVVTFILMFIAQVSMVLFPALRTLSKTAIKSAFIAIRSTISFILPVVYLLYLPVFHLMIWWLPAYSDTLGYLALLFPVVILNSIMDICLSTFYKVLRYEKSLLAINFVSFVASGALSVYGAYVLSSMMFVLCSCTFVVSLRYLFSDYVLRTKIGVVNDSLPYSIVLISLLFVVSNIYLDKVAAFIVLIVSLVLYSLVHRKRAHVLRMTLFGSRP